MSCFVIQLLLALFPNLVSLMLSTFLLLESVQKKKLFTGTACPVAL